MYGDKTAKELFMEYNRLTKYLKQIRKVFKRDKELIIQELTKLGAYRKI